MENSDDHWHNEFTGLLIYTLALNNKTEYKQSFSIGELSGGVQFCTRARNIGQVLILHSYMAPTYLMRFLKFSEHEEYKNYLILLRRNITIVMTTSPTTQVMFNPQRICW